MNSVCAPGHHFWVLFSRLYHRLLWGFPYGNPHEKTTTTDTMTAEHLHIQYGIACGLQLCLLFTRSWKENLQQLKRDANDLKLASALVFVWLRGWSVFLSLLSPPRGCHDWYVNIPISLTGPAPASPATVGTFTHKISSISPIFS